MHTARRYTPPVPEVFVPFHRFREEYTVQLRSNNLDSSTAENEVYINSIIVSTLVSLLILFAAAVALKPKHKGLTGVCLPLRFNLYTRRLAHFLANAITRRDKAEIDDRAFNSGLNRVCLDYGRF